MWRATTLLAAFGFLTLGVQGIAYASAPKPGPAPTVAKTKPIAGHADAAHPARIAAPASAVPTRSNPPAAGTYQLTLPGTGAWARLGTTGLALALTHPGARATRLTVQVLTAAAARVYTSSGIALRVTNTSNPTGAVPAVSVSVASGKLSGLAGADYAAHLQWSELSGAGRARLVSRIVAASSAGMPSALGPTAISAAAQRAGALVAVSKPAPHALVLAAATSPNAANGAGTFSATTLSPSSQWNVSPQTGDFTWSYPLRTPPAAAGPSPGLSIGYDSGSIDGQTGSTNNQPSVVGQGFGLVGGGFIERSYVPCNTVGIASSSDDCWKTDNATLSLGGQAGQLVESSAGVWHVQGDDNTKITHLTSATLCANGTYDNDCWQLTTPDGSQYFFGRNELPGWTTPSQNTNSAWTVPVCGTATTACTAPGGVAGPFNTQAWRWNLDYVVDPHGNSEAFYYNTETNKYAKDGSTTVSTPYVRGGSLARIDYGMHAGYELTQKAPDQVVFTSADRCETGVSGEPSGACSETSPNATYWPDVPWYENCTASSCAGQSAPSFWTIKRLSAIQTQYWNGTAYVPVDQWSLAQNYPAPGDGTSASLTLTSIAHTGLVGGTSASLTTSFGYSLMANRVAPPNGIVPLMKSRLQTLNTDTGAQLTVNYLASDCSGSSPATPQSNTKRCFPQYWAPPGYPLALDWFNKYLVSSVVANPETGGTADAFDITSYDYSLGAPAWRLDTSPLMPDGQRTWSVFAGYNKVRIEHGDPGSPSTLQTAVDTFFQGMDGDLADATGTKRSVTLTASDGTTASDSLWWAGRVFESQVYNGLGGAIVSDTVTTPWSSNPTDTGATVTEHIGTSSTTFTYTPTARYTSDATIQVHTPLSTGGTRTTQTNTTYDNLGRAIKVEDLGDVSVPAQARCTDTSYADNTTSWMINYPNEVQTFAGTCSGSLSASNAISDSKISYDGQAWGTAPTHGDATQTRVVNGYPGGSANWITSGTATFDALGRRLTSTDAMSRLTSTVYTPAAPAAGQSVTSDIGAVTQIATTDPMGFTSTDTYSPAWGALTATADANNHTTTATYDAFGRRTGVWLPDRQPAANYATPSIGYAYTITAGQPVSVATTSLTHSGGTMTAYQLYDGLLRPRQTQAPAEGSNPNATPGTSGSDITDTIYDSAGRVVTTNPSYLISPAPSGTLFVPADGETDLPGSTQITYDGAGRKTADITDVLGVEQWRTSYAYPGSDRTDVTPPAGGTAATTYTDARGNTTALLQYHGGTIGDPTQPSQYDKTSYAYNLSDQMTAMTNQAGEHWSWSYDQLGHVTAATDPTSGTTSTSYDLDGKTQSVTDANGSTLYYSYDADGRHTAVNQTNTAGPLLDSWSYDATGAKGLLASSSSYTGSIAGTPGTAYTETITGYDANDRPLGSSISLPAGTLGSSSAAYTYTTSLTYNLDGSQATQIEPSVGGLPAETVTTGYTSIGHQYSLNGKSSYLIGVVYNGIGQVQEADHYNGVNALYDTYTYTEGTNRLATNNSFTGKTGGLVAARTYSYDNAGDVTAISNAPSSGANDTQCFNYDYLQRLSQAWTPADGHCTEAASSTNLGGPAPYWQAYGYDSNGNRTSLTNYPTGTGGTAEQDTYTYGNSAQPNELTGVTHATAPSGVGPYTPTGTDTYASDSAGQTTGAAGSTLSWTPQGQLASISTSSAQTQSRIYDASGNLLVQSDPVHGTVAYLGDTELLVPAGSSVVSGQRTYSALGHAVAVRTATAGVTGSTLTWLDTDPQGTAEITENPTTGATTTRQFDPFGNPRGTTVAWPTNNGFLNQSTDPLTALDNLGARVYQPTLGRFLSRDPVFDPSDPQQDNGYAYAKNNPTTASDPNGRHAVDDNGQIDPYWAADQRQNIQHGCSNCGSNGGNNYTGGDTGGYYGGYASASAVPPDQATIAATRAAASPYPVFQPNAISKNSAGGLTIAQIRINKLMHLSNEIDLEAMAVQADPDLVQQMKAAANPPPPAYTGPQLVSPHCGFICAAGVVAGILSASGKAALNIGAKGLELLAHPGDAARILGVSIGYCAAGGAGSGIGISGEACNWTTPSGQNGTTLSWGWGASGPLGAGAGVTMAFSNARSVDDLSGKFDTRSGAVETPIGGVQGSYATGKSAVTNNTIWVAAAGFGLGGGVNFQSFPTYTTVLSG